jgi:endonuclease YncB( thermonuclease family)
MSLSSRGLARLAGALLLVTGTAGAWADERSPTPGGPVPCTLRPTQTVASAAAVDGRTLRLPDGAEVRLAGLAGLEFSGAAAGAADAAAAQAATILGRLIAGEPLAIQVLGEDRYGRRLGLVAPAGDEPGPLLQQALLSGGLAVASSEPLPPGCGAEFLAAERTARTAHLGVWADPRYLIVRAEQPATVATARGRFALVEGKVLSVRDRGATIYVNFGRRWSEDFTVTIAKRNERSFIAAGIGPKSLAGRRVLIRGWIDERGGPWIEAVRPEQIEFADRD